jgi:hypothetical protein
MAADSELCSAKTTGARMSDDPCRGQVMTIAPLSSEVGSVRARVSEILIPCVSKMERNRS